MDTVSSVFIAAPLHSQEGHITDKCNRLESSPNHPPDPWSVEKLSSMKLVPAAKKLGD